MYLAVVILAALGGLFGILYYFNSKTPVPKGCENLKSACEGCKISSCGNHPDLQKEKGEIKE